jgi:hypothetical protein
MMPWLASTVVKFALAAGNESDDASNHHQQCQWTPTYTISYGQNGYILLIFSNYGLGVDFCAPGVAINPYGKTEEWIPELQWLVLMFVDCFC